MAGPVHDSKAMVRGMAPVRRSGRFVFCTARDRAVADRARDDAIASFAEDEGLSLILPAERAAALGFDSGPPMACITLTVHSALEGVGLTAAVAGALAEAGIPCNMVAAYHHDHAFVPEARAGEALALLRARAAAEP